MVKTAWIVLVPSRMLKTEEILLVARKRILVQITTPLLNAVHAQDTIPIQDIAPLLTMATVHQGTEDTVLQNTDVRPQIMACLLTVTILLIVLQDTAPPLVTTILPPVLQITTPLPGTMLQNTTPLLATGLHPNMARPVVL